MPDPSTQLQRLADAGFQFQAFERYPRAVGVLRGECIVLLEFTPSGLRMLGSPGWRMGEVLGVLTTVGGRQVFQYKSEVVEATPERLAALRSLRQDVERLLETTQ